MGRRVFWAVYPILFAGAPAATTAGAPTPAARPLVWVADGAGDFRGCSDGLLTAGAYEGHPFELSVFVWQHGYRRVVIDQIDWPHAREQGGYLATLIRDRAAAEPGRRVVLVAHSAGCAVALAAAERVPPNTLDRLVLFAPSVSCRYDLRPALRGCKEGIDVFCSEKDTFSLGLAMHVLRTTDPERSAAAAGRYGFRPAPGSAPSPWEASRVRHHFWSKDQAWTGHTGGHSGMHAPDFSRGWVFPVIRGQ